jgi:hypothetical protein
VNTRTPPWRRLAVLPRLLRRVVLTFRGGLVDSRTGEELPNAPTGRYAIEQAEAKRIDWSDEDAIEFGIDWSLYRTFTHPALKQD